MSERAKGWLKSLDADREQIVALTNPDTWHSLLVSSRFSLHGTAGVYHSRKTISSRRFLSRRFSKWSPSSKRLAELRQRLCRKPTSTARELPFSCRGDPLLTDEKQQFLKRRVDLNVGKLCDIVTSLTNGASVCKIDNMEGGFSKALLMATENGVEVVAKIPYPNAGRARYSTASEAAVLRYVRWHITIPVPKILAWSADPSNPVGAEYIVMEKAPGIQLSKVYDDIAQTGRLSLIKGLTQLEKQFSTIQFLAYGNLYFRHSISKESERHLLDSSLDPTGSYCIGPACGPAWTDAISPADKKTRALSEHVRTVCTEAYEVATCINNKDAYNARWNMSQVLLPCFICIEDLQDSGHVPLLAYFIEKICSGLYRSVPD